MNFDRRAIILLFACFPCFGVTATMGLAFTRPFTASTTIGSDTIVISAQANGDQQLEVGQILAIQGESDYVIVTTLSQVGYPATTSTTLKAVKWDWTPFAAAATASNLSVRLIADFIDHTSVRIWSMTDVTACSSAGYDKVSHAASTSYLYRSAETACWTTQAVDVVGLDPGAVWHFRLNLKPTYGTDNTGACNTDGCGAIDIALKTPPDNHFSDGRPPLPTLPDSMPAQIANAPDVSAYTVISLPQFLPTTGSINNNSTQLVLSSSPAGLVGDGSQWIVIAGGKCNHAGAYAPWCHVTNKVGNTLTLEQAFVADDGLNKTNVEVSWGLYTVQKLIESGSAYRYGVVYEFKQGYLAKMWRTDGNEGGKGLWLGGLPADDNPSCSTHPCSIDDPAHRWIVFRTAPTPGALPPPGIRTGPEYASVLGGVESQDSAPSFFYSGWGENSQPAHHIRLENLHLTASSSSAMEADPFFKGGHVEMKHGGWMPKYVVFDRVYFHPPDVNTRSYGFGMTGHYGRVTNSYLRFEYWQPWVFHYGPDINTEILPSTVGATITLPGVQWQRQREQPLVTQGNATITTSGTASGDVQVYIVMDAQAGNGAEVRYTSGRGVTIACGACRAVNAIADPTPTVTQRKVYRAKVANGASVFSDTSHYNSSEWNTEGIDGVHFDYGDHYWFDNNYIESYGKGFFVDVPLYNGEVVASPSHITFRRNQFEWKQDHRNTDASSNGLNYYLRHCGWEMKRGRFVLTEGNTFVGCWASVNSGAAMLISLTAFDFAVMGAATDFTIRYNVCENIAECFSINPHYTSGYSTMGADASRIYFGHNVARNQNAWRQHSLPGPAQYFYGRTGLYCSHDTVVDHNTFFDNSSLLPTWNVCGEDHMEGLWLTNNIYHLNIGAYGSFQTQRENGGMAPVPDVIASSIFGGATFDTAWTGLVARQTGSTPVSTFALQKNLIVCGNQQNGGSPDQHVFDSAVDFTAAQCAGHQARFGSLAAQNYFISSPDAKSARTAAVKWADPAGGDLRFLYDSPYLPSLKSTDGKPLGADVVELDRRRGIITNLRARDVRASGVRGCSSSSCAYLEANVPDKGVACRAAYGALGSPVPSWTLTAPDTSTTESRSFALSGLAAGVYSYRILCAGAATVESTFTVY